jgi:gliding motility-associated-like protein
MPTAYRWSDGSTDAHLLVRQPGTYAVKVQTECGSYTATRRIRYEPCGQLSAEFIPNIITPDGDGLNDYFVVPGLMRQSSDWTLTVYNKWGVKVFETATYRNDWGTHALAGNYYYLLKESGTNATIKGWLEVIR